jgi:hypothetical protein
MLSAHLLYLSLISRDNCVTFRLASQGTISGYSTICRSTGTQMDVEQHESFRSFMLPRDHNSSLRVSPLNGGPIALPRPAAAGHYLHALGSGPCQWAPMHLAAKARRSAVSWMILAVGLPAPWPARTWGGAGRVRGRQGACVISQGRV